MTRARPESVAEFTFRAVLAGVALGVVFGAANAYIGLRVAMTVSASIPAAVMTVALFRLFGAKGTILEANLSQTIGSASTSLATGTIFTIPALFLWGMAPPYLQVVVLALLGGVLGLAAMIPLRRLLIVDAKDELPYPEGTACAEVLRATAEGAKGSGWIFAGMGVGAAVKILVSLVALVPSEVSFALPVLPKAVVALELAAALLAVGFILGYRQSAVLVAGSVVASLVLIPLIAWIGGSLPGPLLPETTMTIGAMSASQIWSRYVKYIGAGAVAAAGILTLARSLPSMVGAFAAVAKGLTSRGAGAERSARPETDRDLPPAFVGSALVLVIAVCAFVPGVFAGNLGFTARLVSALGVGLFGVFFVAVAARIVGIVGVSSQPTSGIALVTVLGTASVFAAMGYKGLPACASVLTVGTVVAIAASKAGDISQDLKTGALVGATPAKQQLGQLIGASVACWAVAGTVLLLGQVYTFGSRELAAPQATLMKTIIEGVLSGALPWGLVLTGAGVAISAMLCGVSGLAFAIGVYLPFGTMATIYVGGCLRAFVDRRWKAVSGESDPGVLAASGLVAGEGLAGVFIALLVALKVVGKAGEPRLAGVAGSLATLLVLGLASVFLVLAGRARRAADGSV